MIDNLKSLQELSIETKAPIMAHIFHEIEAEIANRYIELPLDSDGFPIRLGDTLYGNEFPDGSIVVHEITYHRANLCSINGYWLELFECHHTKS